MSIALAHDTITPSLRALATFQGAGRRRILQAAGNIVVSISRNSFTNPALRPLPWPARKRNRKRNGQSTGLLIWTRELFKNITITHLDDSSVKVGVASSCTYAGFHQGGTKHIPARPFLPFNAPGTALTPHAAGKVREIIEAGLAALARQR